MHLDPKKLIALTCLMTLLAACGDAATDAGGGAAEGGLHAVPDVSGKADNYISTNAREFILAGAAHAELPSDFDQLDPEAQQAAIDQAVSARLSTVSRSLERHVDDVIDAHNDELGEEQKEFFIYMRRNAGQAVSQQLTDDGRVAFEFEVELVGSVYLMSVVAPDDGGQRSFTIEVTDWGDTTGEQVEVVITGSPSRDAFPKYDELFADGVYDIAIHFGGDYNEERFDLETARWTVQYLLDGGWQNEAVSSFDDLGVDSPPFTRQMTVEGRPVEARVYVYHSDMVTPERETELSDAMMHSFAQRDVVIYSGHAGPDAGFILDYQPRHEIDDDAFAQLPLADKYQIYVFDGCQTYRTYVDDLMANERKTFANLDIVTTVNTTPFAVGYQVIHQFLYWLTLTDQAGGHMPLTWKTLLRGVNTEDYADVHYGVHGIDEDPGLNPHSGAAPLCQSCSTDADCGAGGNLCLGYGGGGACGVACATDPDCPDGYRCARLYDDPDLFYIPKQCVKRDYVCGAGR